MIIDCNDVIKLLKTSTSGVLCLILSTICEKTSGQDENPQ